MRFSEDGPAIPDELLQARDEGRVVFFCGAGVSQAKAGLPGFFGLAEKVMETLGVQADSPARKLLDEARNVETQIGVAGVIPADRIFGLLERDFSTDAIEAAVASVLQPNDKPDLTAHRTILDLATTREGLVRIVTTNFDRLFDNCGLSLSSWQRPRLPDPSRPKDMDGIVYLHGKATSDYQGAEGDGFILSSSQFGQAYLSEGWATSFFREIIDRYVVVFVGYAADDPPVHYLLEGLNKQINERQVYAFQEGAADDAASKWNHRGVQAISYAEDSGHTALWDTLEAWAQRARDPDKWYSEVINKAKQGPQSLLPHERGQVAHVVSTVEGVRKFSGGEEPPPAEWLCVFDKYRRYGKPGRLGSWLEEGPYVDPFDLYCIDSDVPPDNADPSGGSSERKVPSNAWDAFDLNRVDKTNLNDDNFASITSHRIANVPSLPSRLRQMGVWIRAVVGEPAAVWWAVRQNPLHPEIRRAIRRDLTSSQRPINSTVREAWYYLLEYWEQDRDIHADLDDWNELRIRISKDGWRRSVIRAYAACYRPYLKVEPSWGYPKPLELKDKIRLSDLIRLDVAYPDHIKKIDIPDKWIAPVVVVLCKNLETALELETEIGRGGLSQASSIVSDNDTAEDRTHGLSGAVINFTSVFERLMQIDPKAARREFSKWSIEDDTIFARLRIWAAGKPDVVSDDQFGSVLADVSDTAFWNNSHEWDLLHTLSARWNGLSDDICVEIEKRLLKGCSRRQEEEEDFKKRRARSILARITWLSRKGCKLYLNLEEETNRLRELVPEWKPENADEVVRYWGTRVRTVTPENDYSALLDIPLASVLPEVHRQSGRRDDPFVEDNPFAGLSAARPVRAFSALRVVAKEGDFPDWAWNTFLNAEKRKTDKLRFVVLIAERLARYLNNGATVLVWPAASWLENMSGSFSGQYPASFRRVTDALIRSLAEEPESGASGIWQVGEVRDWVTTALNAPAGKVAQALRPYQKTDPSTFLNYAGELLALPGDLRRHALAIFSEWIDWFYGTNREWSEENLLSALDSCDLDDREAFWGGFFYGTVSQELFMRLKRHLLQLTREDSETRREHSRGLSRIILFGWGSIIEGTSDRCVSNEEFRDVLVQADDEFRSHVLRQVTNLSCSEEQETRSKWTSWLPEFLRDVWPLHRKANLSAVSASLCDLVFSNEELFPELVEIILLRLAKIDDHFWRWYKAKDFGEKHPRHTLDLLYAVLPNNVSGWPDDIGDIFASISEGEPALRTDEKFLELKRRWDSR